LNFETYPLFYRAPFGDLAIQCTETTLLNITFLASPSFPSTAKFPLAGEIFAQLDAYFKAADFVFDLPFVIKGTPHQQAVWRAIETISIGQTRSYGVLAAEIGSSAQAVGQACGNNPIPIIIPCHRVVAKTGLGGFFHQKQGQAVNIKHWLLQHEQSVC
jgi:methylated-DNA-[protein]-cysteine S-methyltransferase